MFETLYLVGCGMAMGALLIARLIVFSRETKSGIDSETYLLLLIANVAFPLFLGALSWLAFFFIAIPHIIFLGRNES